MAPLTSDEALAVALQYYPQQCPHCRRFSHYSLCGGPGVAKRTVFEEWDDCIPTVADIEQIDRVERRIVRDLTYMGRLQESRSVV